MPTHCARRATGAAFLEPRGPLHVHNQPGAPSVRIGVKEFMCIGALPPFDHPHIFIDMGEANEARCSYCSTLFLYDARLGRTCDPAACAYTPELESIYEAEGPESETTPYAFGPVSPMAAARSSDNKTPAAGVMGGFQTEAQLRRALEQLRASGLADLQTFAPQGGQGPTRFSPLPWIILICGLIALACGLVLRDYAHAANLPRGFSWPSLAPIAFVVGVALCATGGAAIARGLFNARDCVDDVGAKRGAASDCWFVLARADDLQRRAQSRAILESLDAKGIEEVAT